ncbi:MAG: HIT family protein [Acidobacteriota bacterium]
MSADCLFCRIVRGEIPCAKVYENDAVLAFLDIAPVNKGHTLVIPKAHHADVYDLPPALGARLLEAVQAVGASFKGALGATGMNLGMNNGASAGQMVFHAHWHLIPRFDGDGLSLWPQKSYASIDEMSELARKIASFIR